MSERKCFYCNDTGFIEGKEIRLVDKLPEQICPFCEIGQAVYRGFKKANQVQLAKYDTIKRSHEKLRAFIKEHHPLHQHDHEYYHDDCALCLTEKSRLEPVRKLLEETKDL